MCVIYHIYHIDYCSSCGPGYIDVIHSPLSRVFGARHDLSYTISPFFLFSFLYIFLVLIKPVFMFFLSFFWFSLFIFFWLFFFLSMSYLFFSPGLQILSAGFEKRVYRFYLLALKILLKQISNCCEPFLSSQVSHFFVNVRPIASWSE